MVPHAAEMSKASRDARRQAAAGPASRSRYAVRQRSVTSTALNVYRCRSTIPFAGSATMRREPLEQAVRPVEAAGPDQPGDEPRVLDQEPVRVGDADPGADREQSLRLGDARQAEVDRAASMPSARRAASQVAIASGSKQSWVVM